MNKVKIITDSCCSLTAQQLEKLGVDYVSMDITMNGVTHNSFNYPIKDYEEFYNVLERAESCSTSCVNTFTFEKIFEKYVKNGFDVFYVGLSSGMSCTNSNAQKAAEELNERWGKHVWVADSLTGSYPIAFDVEKAKQMADEGKSAQEIFDVIHNNGLKTFAIFAPGDLKFLRRSGRISKFVASIGSILKIVPVITTNDKGELKLFSKSIGRKKAIESIQNFCLKHADLESEGKIIVGHTGQKTEAERLAEFLRQHTKNKQISVKYIDYTMGCNCGPKTLAVFGFLR